MSKATLEQKIRQMKPRQLREALFHAEQARIDQEVAKAARRKSYASRQAFLAKLTSLFTGTK